MGLQAIVRPRLDRDSHTLSLTLLRVSDSLVDIQPGVPREGVMQTRNELLTVVFRHGHEGTSHDTVDDSQSGETIFETLNRLTCTRPCRRCGLTLSAGRSYLELVRTGRIELESLASRWAEDSAVQLVVGRSRM